MSATDYIVCGILVGIVFAALWLMLAVAYGAWTKDRWS